MEKIYYTDEQFEDYAWDALKVGVGTESTVLKFGEDVLKLLLPSYLYLTTKFKMNILSKIKNIDEYLTVAIKEFYINYHYTGFVMENAGISLKDYYINNDISLNEMIRILKKIRDGIEFMRKNNIVHGDIQPSNILINGSDVKIGDINNVKYKMFQEMHLNEISTLLSHYCNYSSVLDIQCLNFFTILFLELPRPLVCDYLRFGAASFDRINLDEIPNHHFDEDVFQDQKYILKKTDCFNEKYIETHSKYLIDYLK